MKTPNGFSKIVFLFVFLGSWSSVFSQSRLDIRKLASGQHLQEPAGGQQPVDDRNAMLALNVRKELQWKPRREKYLTQLGEVLEERQQNERLTAAQRAKLWLAGVGDIEKFMQSQELALAGAQELALAREIRILDNNQLLVIRGNNINIIHVGGGRGPLFGAGSMLASVSKRLSRDDPEVKEYRRQVAVAAEELLLTDLESVMPLTAKQHKAVLDLLETHRPTARYAHFRKHYFEAMDCLLDHSQELRTEFDKQQLKNFERMVVNTQTAVGKPPIPDL